jgi:GT2 family glycosyltransferase
VEASSPAAVDVVIVNYRSYEELNRCLASLERSRTGLNEVVVVDHESDEHAAADITARFPWARLVERSINEGFATGVNWGARLTSAPFLLLLNPDCVVRQDAIARLTAYAATRPDAAVVGPCILNADGSVQGSARRFPGITTAIAGRSSWLTRRFPRNPLSRHNLPTLEGQMAPLDVDWVSGACMLVRRTAFEQVGGMDEHFFLYWEDADLCRRLEKTGWRTVFFPGAIVVHAGGRSSIHVYRESLAAFHRSAYLLYRKHAPWPASLLRPFVFLALQARLRLVLRIKHDQLKSVARDEASGSRVGFSDSRS